MDGYQLIVQHEIICRKGLTGLSQHISNYCQKMRIHLKIRKNRGARRG